MSSRKDKKPKKKKGKKSHTGALSCDNSTQGGFLVVKFCVGFFLNLGRKHFGGPKKKKNTMAQLIFFPSITQPNTSIIFFHFSFFLHFIFHLP